MTSVPIISIIISSLYTSTLDNALLDGASSIPYNKYNAWIFHNQYCFSGFDLNWNLKSSSSGWVRSSLYSLGVPPCTVFLSSLLLARLAWGSACPISSRVLQRRQFGWVAVLLHRRSYSCRSVPLLFLLTNIIISVRQIFPFYKMNDIIHECYFGKNIVSV